MRKLFLLVGVFASLLAGFAQDKVKPLVVQSVGLEILPIGTSFSEVSQGAGFVPKGDFLAFYDRGGRIRFRAEGGVSLYSHQVDGTASPVIVPNAAVAVGFRVGERSDMRTYFTGYLGAGTQYLAGHGLARKIFLDLHFSYYLTNRFCLNAIARANDYGITDAYYFMGGIGVSYTL